MHRYIALIHKDAGTDYGVMFPDFPGCVTAAKTMDDALVQAREALAFHAEGMRLDGQTLPSPRTLDVIKASGENWIDWQGAVVAAVPLVPPKGEAVRVNINIDKNLLDAADDAARRAHQSRSAFIARALETALDG